jgi:hypothetical protein
MDADGAFATAQVVPLFYSAVAAVFDFKVAEVPGGEASSIAGDDGFADPAIGSVVAVGKGGRAFLDGVGKVVDAVVEREVAALRVDMRGGLLLKSGAVFKGNSYGPFAKYDDTRKKAGRQS